MCRISAKKNDISVEINFSLNPFVFFVQYCADTQWVITPNIASRVLWSSMMFPWFAMKMINNWDTHQFSGSDLHVFEKLERYEWNLKQLSLKKCPTHLEYSPCENSYSIHPNPLVKLNDIFILRTIAVSHNYTYYRSHISLRKAFRGNLNPRMW